MILSGRWFIGCVAIGVALGTTMIVTHHGPGIIPPATAESPSHRNEVRQQDLISLATALRAYTKDHSRLPIELSSNDSEICTGIGPDCRSVSYIDLGFLINGGHYIDIIPRDPGDSHKQWSSGYFVAQLANGTFRLRAPKAELGQTIEITR